MYLNLIGLPRMHCFVECRPKYGTIALSIKILHCSSAVSNSRKYIFRKLSNVRSLANLSSLNRLSLSAAWRYFMISSNLFRGIEQNTRSLRVSLLVLQYNLFREVLLYPNNKRMATITFISCTSNAKVWLPFRAAYLTVHLVKS